MEKCSEYKHLREIELYCKSCNCSVCIKCISKHEHPVISIDELIQEMDSANLLEVIKEKHQSKIREKDSETQKFDTEIKTHHEKQIEIVTNHFKDLQNQLAAKESQLKNDLNTYFKDNRNNYYNILTNLEGEIEDLGKFIELLSPDSKSIPKLEIIKKYINHRNSIENNSNNRLSKLQNGNSDKKNIDEKKNEVTSQEEKESNDADIDVIDDDDEVKSKQLCKGKGYQVFSFRDVGVASSKLIDLMVLAKKWISENRSTIISFSENGVEKFFIDRDHVEHQVVLAKDAPNSPVISGQKNTYYIYQTNSIKDKTYIFYKSKYWVLNTGDNLPNWVGHSSPIVNSALSSIYDGKDHIYIMGGFNEGTNSHVTNIYKFNIHREAFEQVGNLLVPGCVFNLTVSPSKNKIYIFGGYGKPGGVIDRIDEFDTITNTCTNVCKLKELGMKCLYNVIGCYVEKTNTFYILDENNFFKYNPETKSITPLESLSSLDINNLNQYHRSKLFYNGNDTIYLFSSGNKDIYSYSITDENAWTTIPFLGIPVSHSFYYSFVQ